MVNAHTINGSTNYNLYIRFLAHLQHTMITFHTKSLMTSYC